MARSRDIETATVPAERSKAPASAFVITVIDGHDRGRSAVLERDGARVLVGKSPVCALRLTDPRVSRRHAALSWTDGRACVLDLRSTNGTTVNGVQIREAYLGVGDVLRIGDTTVRVAIAEGGAEPVPPATRWRKVLGASVEMRKLYPLFERVAASDVNLVIEGETGTGKEVLAESIHEASPRAQGPFVVFDCAVASGLVESELFEQADGGTLFIDEIAELSMTHQPKLLRAIERGEVRRAGSETPIRVNVRVITATRRDLDHEVQEGRFRDDLFFRLSVARIELPPLRDRKDDIAFLTDHFWRELEGTNRPVPYDVMQRFLGWTWPGNVRELRNAVARQVALGQLDVQDRGLSSSARRTDDPFERVLAERLPFPRARDRILEEFERLYVTRVLAEHGGVVARAAEASGIARRYFNTIKARTRR